jgi:hypothetical protein
VVIDPHLVGSMESGPVHRAELARSAATAAPREIGHQAVLEHGIRHLAWLVREDPIVKGELAPEWHMLLAEYVPEPFRNL